MKDDKKEQIAKKAVKAIYWLMILALIVLSESEWMKHGSTRVSLIPLTIFYGGAGFLFWQFIEKHLDN